MTFDMEPGSPDRAAELDRRFYERDETQRLVYSAIVKWNLENDSLLFASQAKTLARTISDALGDEGK